MDSRHRFWPSPRVRNGADWERKSFPTERSHDHAHDTYFPRPPDDYHTMTRPILLPFITAFLHPSSERPRNLIQIKRQTKDKRCPALPLTCFAIRRRFWKEKTYHGTWTRSTWNNHLRFARISAPWPHHVVNGAAARWQHTARKISNFFPFSRTRIRLVH